MSDITAWPVIAGTYQVGDPQGPVAVCVNTSDRLMEPLARLPGVAISGKVFTANLGIERIVTNITANPAIRFLLLCGKDSPLFRPGQSLVALAERGMDAQHRIIDALGYDPVLPALADSHITQFRQQIEVIDWSGEEDLPTIERRIGELVARNPGRFTPAEGVISTMATEEHFTIIRPGGQREPLQYDPKGYFVITLDREEEQIVLRHYLPDHTAAHEMRGRMAGSMLLGLLREGLITQLSHAGYLGEELAKAQAALHLGLRYDQDRPLRAREETATNTPTSAPPTETSAENPPTQRAGMPSMRQIPMPLSLAQVQATAPGTVVDVVCAVTDQPAPDLLIGTFLEADEAEPFSAFRRTTQPCQIHWTAVTKLIMGDATEIHVGALLRAHGPLSPDLTVEAEQVVILTHVARIIEA